MEIIETKDLTVFEIERRARKQKQDLIIRFRTLEDELYVENGARPNVDDKEIRRLKHLNNNKLNIEYEYCQNHLIEKLIMHGKI